MATVHPATVLKRKRDDDTCDYCMCLICQLPKTEQAVRSATDQGKQRVRSAASERMKLNDIEFATQIDRIQNIPENDWAHTEMKWHNACYCTFTSEGRLQRLRKKQNAKSNESAVSADDEVKTRRVSRSACCPVDWKRCIFCQSDNIAGMSNIETPKVSRKIIQLSNYDIVMGVRLSGIEDLIASEGKYHLKCLVVFERKTTIRMNTMSQPERDKTDNILDQLGENLANGLARGNVYNMSIVWDTYSKMCKEHGIRPANRFISRRSTFKDAISERVGQKASFVRPLGKTSSHFMYPRDKSKFVIAKTLTHMTENDDDIHSDLVDDTKQDHTLHDIVHTALQLRNDLAETPGHSGAWGGIDETGVDKVIPDNVYTFLSVLFGGTAVLESDECEVEMKRLTCSIAQDIVFAASRGKKLTPKHVGLGMTLHQATRSEKLVSLFHAAGHCIGMDRIRRMDTTIANDILDEYERNECVYIPSDIVPYESGRLIVSSCDNIDVLEETLDGKNTFHCTQMVVWQRGPPPQRPACEKVVKQDRALNRERLEKLHQLDNAKLPTGSKPSPQFHEECQIQPESWFHESEEKMNQS